ncbi:hypothetical protein DPMN_098397 [Dreissena polymorpha]|uniref:Uncharacterized protein n=1 Tax=Dreissena polymorpha TaxID=45954 RepID=A0A9D4R6N1_DREPO|nr:hypothetical protein DPMN_098397 [Dreissena polymorpha]
MVCKQNGWAAPDKYNLHPVNSNSLLFHWRVLTVLLFNLSVGDRKHFQQEREEKCEESDVLIDLEELVEVDSVGFNFEITRTYEHSGPSRVVGNDPISEVDPITEQSSLIIQPLPSYPDHDQFLDRSQNTGIGNTILKAWDSHFHLDRTSQTLFGHQEASLVNILAADVGVMPKIKVEVVGGIMVYCENYPTNIKCQRKVFGTAVGIHPTKAPFFTPNLRSSETF